MNQKLLSLVFPFAKGAVTIPVFPGITGTNATYDNEVDVKR